jgi:large subunit ribosomal protein L25
MEIVKLSATQRSTQGAAALPALSNGAIGKGPARRLRREGLIPAIAYGQKKEALPLAVAPKALRAVLLSEHGRNSVIELSVEGGEKFNAMVREFSIHPVSRELMHADFFCVDLQGTVDVSVPFRTTGKPKGVTLGGVLQQTYRDLPIRCRPDLIPVFLELDVTEVDLGASAKVSELKLPEGVSVRLPQDQTVVTVHAPEKREEDEAKPAAGAPAAKGAAAAPAAAAKAPAKDAKKK